MITWIYVYHILYYIQHSLENPDLKTSLPNSIRHNLSYALASIVPYLVNTYRGISFVDLSVNRPQITNEEGLSFKLPIWLHLLVLVSPFLLSELLFLVFRTTRWVVAYIMEALKLSVNVARVGMRKAFAGFISLATLGVPSFSTARLFVGVVFVSFIICQGLVGLFAFLPWDHWRYRNWITELYWIIVDCNERTSWILLTLADNILHGKILCLQLVSGYSSTIYSLIGVILSKRWEELPNHVWNQMRTLEVEVCVSLYSSS